MTCSMSGFFIIVHFLILELQKEKKMLEVNAAFQALAPESSKTIEELRTVTNP